jgi:GNAT superfamily N-acetyltransferase
MTEQTSRPATRLSHRDTAPPSAGHEPLLRLSSEAFTSPVAATLLAAADAFNASLYGNADESPLDARQFDPEARGLFVVAFLDGEPVGCGGYRRAEPPAPDNAAEAKRMYVAQPARRAGVGRRVLAALEDAARANGYRQLVLDVGAKQPDAHQFYEAAGYHRIAGFTIYRNKPGNRAYAKTLRSLTD